jgi:hypothetical protein
LFLPVLKFWFDEFFFFILNIITKALFRFSWLWIKTESFGIALHRTMNVVLNSESLALNFVKTCRRKAINFQKTEEDITTIALAHLILGCTSLHLRVFIFLTEALLSSSFHWVTEF